MMRVPEPEVDSAPVEVSTIEEAAALTSLGAQFLTPREGSRYIVFQFAPNAKELLERIRSEQVLISLPQLLKHAGPFKTILRGLKNARAAGGGRV